MYALVEILGKQYKVMEGQTLRVDFLGEEKTADTSLDFDSVLLISKNDKVKIGRPYVSGAHVKASLVAHALGPKVVAYKYKRRKDYERKVGHRQNYTTIKIEGIVGA